VLFDPDRVYVPLTRDRELGDERKVGDMQVRHALQRLAGRNVSDRVVVKEYGRDSLLVGVNLLLAPLFALLGMRVGLQSEEKIASRIQSDTDAMRKKGYLVSSVQTVLPAGPRLVGRDRELVSRDVRADRGPRARRGRGRRRRLKATLAPSAQR
jgi:hypothetical protein